MSQVFTLTRASQDPVYITAEAASALMRTGESGVTRSTLKVESRFCQIVSDVKQGRQAGLEELYTLVKNFTYFLMRQLGAEELQDKIHDIFVTVTQAIREDKLRDPERLVPFLTTVARFYTYNQIQRRRQNRKSTVPLEEINIADARMNLEVSTYRKQKLKIARDILGGMSRRDRDVLHRFYLQEQSKEQICRELKLTPTQFRLIKSKAKTAFTKMGVHHMSRLQVVA